MTSFSEIITDRFMVMQPDDRLTSELATNPALFFRAKSLWLESATSLFNSPPEMVSYLVYTSAVYDDYYYTAESAQTSPVSIVTGKTGFELCSVGIDGTDDFGNPTYTPLATSIYSYDSSTGIVTVNQNIAVNTVIQIDFYTDGQYTNTLTNSVKTVLGYCLQFVWETRFAQDWLPQAQKIHDKNFNPGSEGNFNRANSERYEILLKALQSKIRKYEQNCEYVNTITNSAINPFTPY